MRVDKHVFSRKSGLRSTTNSLGGEPAAPTETTTVRPKRIAFYGNFGSGNLGNECTLQVVVEYVRRNWPDAKLLCLCTVPGDVRARHGIRAIRAALGHPEWTWAQIEQTALPGAPRPTTTHRAEGRARKVLRLVFRRVPLELGQWIRGLILICRTDTLVIPGTQIVSDYLCGPSGWPYDIFKWSMLAALCRTDVVFLSIGVGPLHHPLSRWFIRKSFNVARYRSYRDEHSRHYAASIGLRTNGDNIFPDLAFSLPTQHLFRRHGELGARRVVGLGLKNFSASSDEATVRAYNRYLNTMADFVAWLHKRGYHVRLLIGDVQYDLKPRRDLFELLERRKVATHRPLLCVDDPHTVDALLEQIAQTDIVISPRLHNLILAAQLEIPLIALSDHAKLDSLLQELDLVDYGMSLDTLSIETLITRFVCLERDAQHVKSHLRAQTVQCRNKLQEQYAQVFHPETAKHMVPSAQALGG